MKLAVDRGDSVEMVSKGDKMVEKGCPLNGFAQAFLKLDVVQVHTLFLFLQKRKPVLKEKCPYGRKKAWCESMEGLRMGRESQKTRRNVYGVISRFGETERRGGAR